MPPGPWSRALARDLGARGDQGQALGAVLDNRAHSFPTRPRTQPQADPEAGRHGERAPAWPVTGAAARPGAAGRGDNGMSPDAQREQPGLGQLSGQHESCIIHDIHDSKGNLWFWGTHEECDSSVREMP